MATFLGHQTCQALEWAIGNWTQRVLGRENNLDKQAREFSDNFIWEVMEGADGELSLVELRAASINLRRSLGGSDDLVAKASIWLLENFDSGIASGSGTISYSTLVQAMKVFLQDHWKYEGVLW